ncbi:MAG: hypothetical protein N2749_06300 [Clostridia bacterium]|nr:hypothetical protein [Clostridia bacterium]
MDNFWKNEWELFKCDLKAVADFLTQPVTFGNESLMLKPTVEEVSQRSEESGFWKKQWEMFAQEYDTFLNYVTKPIEFK